MRVDLIHSRCSDGYLVTTAGLKFIYNDKTSEFYFSKYTKNKIGHEPDELINIILNIHNDFHGRTSYKTVLGVIIDHLNKEYGEGKNK